MVDRSSIGWDRYRSRDRSWRRRLLAMDLDEVDRSRWLPFTILFYSAHARPCANDFEDWRRILLTADCADQSSLVIPACCCSVIGTWRWMWELSASRFSDLHSSDFIASSGLCLYVWMPVWYPSSERLKGSLRVEDLWGKKVLFPCASVVHGLNWLCFSYPQRRWKAFIYSVIDQQAR